MNNNLKIKIQKRFKDGNYIDMQITLYLKSDLSLWNTGKFIWKGEHDGDPIIVKLDRGEPSDMAEITKPSDLNIADQIIAEIERVLKQLD